MVVQMLTRREVIRSHVPWQLMLKHAMWMAFEHRRSLEGLPASSLPDAQMVPVTTLEGQAMDLEEEHEDLHLGKDECREDGMCGDGSRKGTEGEQEVSTAGSVSIVKTRRKNDTFYDDYLHSGTHEYIDRGTSFETPMGYMNYYEYGMFVKIIPGNPHALKPNQYAFEEHHDKYDDFVQELRESPAVPFIHGFTMPTKEKDEETHACFMQVLLRPHRCRGPEHCYGCDATHEFCSKRRLREQRRNEHGIPSLDVCGLPTYVTNYKHSYVQPWQLFQAKQLSLAANADVKIHNSRKQPVLQDTTLLRAWWLPGAFAGRLCPQCSRPIAEAALATFASLGCVAICWRRVR